MKLESEFRYYTECQLATLESLRGRKSTAKSELKRQEQIAAGMVAVCRNQKRAAELEERRACGAAA